MLRREELLTTREEMDRGREKEKRKNVKKQTCVLVRRRNDTIKNVDSKGGNGGMGEKKEESNYYNRK